MASAPQGPTRAHAILRTIGYLYSISVFVSATALAAQYWIQSDTRNARGPAAATAPQPNEAQSEAADKNKNNLIENERSSLGRTERESAAAAPPGIEKTRVEIPGGGLRRAKGI